MRAITYDELVLRAPASRRSRERLVVPSAAALAMAIWSGCGRDVRINDGNACTVESRNRLSGAIRHDPVDVDDGNACTVDSCDPVTGVHHDPVAVDDGSACTVDSCDPVTGVHHDPVAVDDGDACTADSCDPLVGVRHDPVPLDDGNPCTIDVCDPLTGVHHEPVPVGDGNACTSDWCDPSDGSIAHEPVAVDDGIACTLDGCDPLAGVSHVPVDGLCELDGLTCTLARCSATTGCGELPDDGACGDPTGCPAARCLGASGAPVSGCGSELRDLNCGALQVCRPSGCAPSAPADQVGNVVVSELSVLGQELVELSNLGPIPLDVRGFVLGNLAGQAADIRAASDLAGDSGVAVLIPAGGQLHGVPNPATGPLPPGASFAYGVPGTAFALADTGDVLSLYSRRGATLQDQVDFRNLASGARVPVGPSSFVAAPGLTTQLDPSSRDALANDSPTAWCTTFYPPGGTRHRARHTAGAPNGSCSGAVISELLAYTSGGDDGRTFVELAGPGGAPVGGMALVDLVASGPGGGQRFADGDLGSGEIDGEYRIPPGTRLPPGGYLAIADGVNSGAQGTSGSLVPGLVAGVDLIARDMDLQDGPASLQLLAPDGGLLDVVAHHALGGARVDAGVAFNGLPLHEASPAVSPSPYTSLARTSASDDRADNRLDFIPSVPTPGAENVPVHLWLGKPDSSAAEASAPAGYLSEKRQYAISYSGLTRNPSWVAWELSSSWMGSQSRTDRYGTDPTLPASIPQAQLADYSGSGWDRGHMCPSADRTLDFTDNAATFFLTNMIPQASNNNQGPWERLESYSRCLASQGRALFVISGGLYEGPVRHTKSGSSVQVPSHTWKVIAVMNAAGQGPADVTTGTRVIAVIMPNDDSLIGMTSPWRSYRVTARAVEQRTGLDFMSQVPWAIQDVVETSLDTSTTLCNGY